MKRMAINGLGRIGRMVLRHYVDARSNEVELVAANDLVPTDNLALSTTVVQGSMAKVRVWYDNEFGYSKRLQDVIERLPL
jgi:glyceraldehyde-3-phosphate dehydrogenase/erythrose-4-phosphate dehydrogenase